MNVYDDEQIVERLKSLGKVGPDPDSMRDAIERTRDRLVNQPVPKSSVLKKSTIQRFVVGSFDLITLGMRHASRG